ncbi:MAG: SDR family oxidoreductase [Verrucomicrobia bacterium]|nr:SDR family oxidoreductase [Verrucomicrobiota bacterium]
MRSTPRSPTRPCSPPSWGAADTKENRARFLGSIPLGRLCQPSDVGNAAVFLADPASNFVTGVCMEVDGGRCI